MSNNQQVAMISKDELHQQIVLAKPTIEKMLPRHLNFEKLEGMVVNTVMGNNKLRECIPSSLIRAVIHSADVGLSLNPVMREADILPVWGSNGSVAQFRPRAIGLMKLARQSGEVVKISAHEVCQEDFFEVEYGDTEKLTHRPPKLGVERGPIIGAYCVWTLKSGVTQFEVLDRKRIDRSRASSEAYKYAVSKSRTDTPWIQDEAEMVRKTAIRAASKYMPMSTENDVFLKALEYDRDDEDVIDGTFTDTPAELGAPAAAGPTPSATSQVAALEAKMGVQVGASGELKGATIPVTLSSNQSQQPSPGPTTVPAAAVSGANTVSSAAPQPSDTSNQGNAQSGTATTASRSRKKTDKPSPEAAGGPAGDEPPPAEPGDYGQQEAIPPGRVAPRGDSPMQDLQGSDIDHEPDPVDFAAEARKMRQRLLDLGKPDLSAWKAFLDETKPMRQRMKNEAPDWFKRIMDEIAKKEEWLRHNVWNG